MRPVFWLTTAVAVTAFTGQQQPPSFRSRVDVVTIDVHVVDRDGQPVRDLRPEDFALTVDGKARRAVAANLVSYGGNPRVAEGTPAAGHREGADPIASPSAAPGRLVLLVVDEANIRAGYARFAADAALALIDRGQPSDRIGLLSIPYSTVRVEPTRDRAVLKQGLQRIAGHLTSVDAQVGAQYAVGLSEAFMFLHDRRAFAQVLMRECVEKVPGATSPSGPCQAEVENLARTMMTDARQRMLTSSRSLSSVIEALGQVEGPKTLVLLSEELPVASFVSERKDFEAETSRISAAAARAQANVYVLHLDSPLFDVENRLHPASATADADLRSSGLETVATLTGGRRLMVSGRAEAAFERILRETSAFYVVGFEAEPADRDGKPHLVRVTANRKGIEVRARRAFVFSEPSQRALTDALNRTPGTPRAAAPPPATTSTAPSPAPAPAPSSVPAAPLPASPPVEFGVAAVPATTPGSAARTVEDLVARAGRYIAAYAAQAAMVIGIEHYAQWMTSPDFGRAISSQLVSEFALLRVKDDWLGFRDVYQVDGRAVGDRQDRLLKLLLDRTPGGIDQGRRIADESARYNLGAIQRNFNVPTTRCCFSSRETRPDSRTARTART